MDSRLCRERLSFRYLNTISTKQSALLNLKIKLSCRRIASLPLTGKSGRNSYRLIHVYHSISLRMRMSRGGDEVQWTSMTALPQPSWILTLHRDAPFIFARRLKWSRVHMTIRSCTCTWWIEAQTYLVTTWRRTLCCCLSESKLTLPKFSR